MSRARKNTTSEWENQKRSSKQKQKGRKKGKKGKIFFGGDFREGEALETTIRWGGKASSLGKEVFFPILGDRTGQWAQERGLRDQKENSLLLAKKKHHHTGPKTASATKKGGEQNRHEGAPGRGRTKTPTRKSRPPQRNLVERMLGEKGERKTPKKGKGTYL